MYLNEIALVFTHQLRGLSREWRAFLLMLGFCILTNVFIVHMHQSGDKGMTEVQSETIRVGLFGSANVLRDCLDEKTFTTSDITKGNLKADVVQNKVAVAIAALPGFSSWVASMPLGAQKSPHVDFIYDSGRIGGTDALLKSREAILHFQEQLMDKHLQSLGIPERWQLQLKYVSAGGKKAQPNKQMHTGNMLTMLIVYTIALLVSTFGIYFLNEEYKKKTFVLLLLSPTSKTSMVIANCLATVVTSGAMFYASYASTIWLLQRKINPLVSDANLSALQPPDEALWLCPLLAIPLLLVSAAIAVFGSTFVRAANQAAIFTGLQIGIMELFAAAIFLPRHSVSPIFGLIPISGNAVCISDALVGIQDVPLLVLSSIGAFVYAFVLLFWAGKRLSKLSTLENIVRDAN